MYVDDAEAAYLQKRIDATALMAGAAQDECARSAHRSLGALYRMQLKGLLRAMAPPKRHPYDVVATRLPMAEEHRRMRGTLRMQCPA
jgi:hypothetical protein